MDMEPGRGPSAAPEGGQMGSVRVNFDMDRGDLALVDGAASAAGMTRAAWIRETALREARGGSGYRLPEAPDGKVCACAFVDEGMIAFDRERFRRTTTGPEEAEERLAGLLGAVVERGLAEHPGFGQVAAAAMRGGDDLGRVLALAGPGEAESALAVLRHELEHDHAGDRDAWFASAVAGLEQALGAGEGAGDGR